MTPSSHAHKKIAVVGAGFGGMAAAIHLARAGHRVTVIDKNNEPGGKLHRIKDQGHTWDVGPSLLTMPHLLEELWQAAGESLEQDLDLVRLPVTCRYRWTDGTVLDEDAAFWSQTEVAAFLEYARGLYAISENAFLRSPPSQLMKQFTRGNLHLLRHFPAMANPATMDQVVRKYFKDPHLIQLFDRFATYNGSSPYRTPSAFNIIPYVQAEFGGWTVRGGMGRIAEAVAALAVRCGVKFRMQTRVDALEPESPRWRVRCGPNVETFDAVVCNADALTAYDALLPHALRKKFRRGPMRRTLATSGFAMLLGVQRKYAELSHHNILFSDDYRAEFHDIFGKQRAPLQPTIYIAVNSITEPELAPYGSDNWFVLVNTPPNPEDRMQWTPETTQAYGDLILRRMSQYGLRDLEQSIRFRRDLSPATFQARSMAWRGSLYGFASHGTLTAFQRPSMQPNGLKNFAFCGGTTHPGGGIPLVLLSGKIAADLLEKGWAKS